MRLAGAGVLAVLLLLFLPLLALAQEPLPLADYVARLQAAQQALAAGDGESAAGLVAGQTTVALAAGKTLAVDGDDLAALIRDEPEAAQTSLATLIALLRDEGRTPPADAAQRLREVFDRPEFQERDSGFWERFWRWVEELLSRLFSGVDVEGSAGLGRAMAWLTGALALLLLLGTLAFFLARMRTTLISGAASTLEVGPGETRTASEARQAAQAAAQAGNLREATRLLYLATLLTLDERGVLRYDRALTNREVLAGVRDQPALHQTLAPVVSTFDRVWYGHVEPDMTEFERYQHEVEALHQRLPTEKGR
jgi:hypothetical protein